MNRIAIVPARGGSKGIPRKNLQMVGSMSLVERAVHFALTSELFQRVIVSTDDADIAAVARKAGAEVPYVRSAATSSDQATSESVVAEMIRELRLGGAPDSTLALIEPTSLPRFPVDVRLTLEAAESGAFDSAVTVTRVPAKFHPLKQFLIGHRGELVDACTRTGDIRSIRRQDLTDSYIRNGIAYAVQTESFIETRSLLGSRAAAIVISHPVVNIDTPSDLLLAQKLMMEVFNEPTP